MKDKRMIDFENDFAEEEEAVFNTSSDGIEVHPNKLWASAPVPKLEPVDTEQLTMDDVDPKDIKEFREEWEKYSPKINNPAVEGTYMEKDIPPEVRVLRTEEAVAKKYKLGLPILEIQKQHGISSGTIYGILARKGIPLRSNARRHSKSQERLSTMTELEKKSLVRDYKDGMSITNIFKKYDINKHGAYLILDEAGVPRRHDREIGSGTDIANEMVKSVRGSQSNKVKKVDAKLEDETLHIHVTVKKDIPVQAFQVNLSYEEDTEGEI